MLHAACAFTSLDLAKLIFEAYPQAVEVNDNNRGSPIHYACLLNVSTDDTEFMFEACQRALEIQGQNGKLPLHYAHHA